jgi:hypothetical protein
VNWKEIILPKSDKGIKVRRRKKCRVKEEKERKSLSHLTLDFVIQRSDISTCFTTFVCDYALNQVTTCETLRTSARKCSDRINGSKKDRVTGNKS